MSTIKANRWAWIVAGLAMLGAGLVLAFMLVFATQNRERYEPMFVWLFYTNVVIASLLGLVIVLALGRLALRIRRGKFGSQLLLKLASIFALVALVPGLLIYGVSYQFVSRSIETWFDVRVEGALDAGLNLGRNTLDNLSDDLGSKTRLAAERMSILPGQRLVDSAPQLLELERLREQLGAESIALVSESGVVETRVGGDTATQLRTQRVNSNWRQDARSKGVISLIDGLDEGDTPRVIALAWMPDRSFSLQGRGHFLMVQQRLPAELVRNALDVQNAYREYQQRSLGREGLRRMYIGTLTLSLVLAVFGAMLLAAILGQQLARPLLLLAEGVRDVAGGDLSPKPIFESKDELGGLTRDFAAMTQQLADARTQAEISALQLDSAYVHVQTILDNLTSGVIVFDRHGLIDTVNPGATRILRAPMAAFEGRPLSEVPGLAEFAAAVQRHFDAFLGDHERHGLDHWQQPFELHASAGGAGQHATSLVARGAELPDSARLLVFDDISEIVSAQRAQAWGEVARRLAHEIKNPLTPIQLSAERLEMKLSGKLPGPEQAILAKSVKTIVDQVDAMKRLVNEFRDYARLPAAELHALDLNALVADVLHLYGEENATVPVEAELDPRCPWIAGDAQQLRQVVHNLLQNAQDATEQARTDAAEAALQPVRISTRWSESSRRVRLTVTDSGGGFPAHILQRAFEPYVTTKPRGTGLGLAVVKKIADEHGARIDLSNRTDDGVVRGAQVSLSFAPVPAVA